MLELSQNEKELIETITEPKEPTDIPAMDLDGTDGTEGTDTELVNINEIAELFGVDKTEILQMIGKE
jgi:hypothetical protein